MKYVKGSDTSLAAAISIEGSTASMRAAILEAIGEFNDGLTCDDVETLFDMKHQTASARIRELALKNLILDTGKRRMTRSGRGARIYKVVQ